VALRIEHKNGVIRNALDKPLELAARARLLIGFFHSLPLRTVGALMKRVRLPTVPCRLCPTNSNSPDRM